MAPQSPLAGVEAVPSLLVSPPTVSSLRDVKEIGRASVPFAIRLPLIDRLETPENLTTTPERIVSVTPVLTVTSHPTT